MKTKLILSLTILTIMGLLVFFFGRGYWMPVTQKITGKRTVSEVIDNHGERARNTLTPYFDKVGISYPPHAITLLAMKEESKLELWATNKEGNASFIRSYDIKKLSGLAGPKLKEGDRQVPEGLYKIIGLNPNSAFHLSMKLNYPNEFDLKHAQIEGRKFPGTNIFIHGKSVSIGCLAMGDTTIEELFVLSEDVGINKISVIISPHDPRVKPLPKVAKKKWVNELYQHIENEYKKYLITDIHKS